jgi:putative pyruvate formate lyase activating enzyme
MKTEHVNMSSSKPVYLKTYSQGLLKEKTIKSLNLLEKCTLCPRKCGVNRMLNEKGFCQTGKHALVAVCTPHFGEEAPLVGTRGAGTIFFSFCNLKCVFCQNYHVSHNGEGKPVSDTELADMMMSLQQAGCHNINFVTPSHVVPQILCALEKAIEKGLTVPLVYDTSGFDSVETLKLLEGVIDIYMPDFKFWNPQIAGRFCDAPDYPEVVKRAVVEMHRQVGDLIMDESGIAQHGLIIRHLVMPGGMAQTREVMAFIANRISPDSYVNIMAQYKKYAPMDGIEALCKSISKHDYEIALREAKEQGLSRFDPQGMNFRK